MKKIYLTLLLLIPALFANAQGPVKAWNDQLDEFIDLFNRIDPTLDQLYGQNGINSTFTYTYFEPNTANASSRYSLTDEGNLIKETTLFESNEFSNVTDELMNEAKAIAVNHLASGARSNARINSILNEFVKRDINVILNYTTEKNGQKLSRQVTITPREIQAAK